MKKIFSDKRAYFAVFGAIGGLLSAFAGQVTGVQSYAFSSWVIGTGFDGLFIAALLALGQGLYVGKSFDVRGFSRSALIGGTGGIIGGLVALYGGYPLAAIFGGGGDVGRFIGWTIGGLVVGFAISNVVPNLKASTASVAGAIGGFVGCGLMYIVSMAVGIATTGAAIGLAIAFAETVFRSAWLEVTIQPRGLSLDKERTLTVTLGKAPVLFGCGSDADVRLAEMEGAKANFAKVSLDGSRVMLQDLITERNRMLSVNETFEISNAKVAVRSKLG